MQPQTKNCASFFSAIIIGALWLLLAINGVFAQTTITITVDGPATVEVDRGGETPAPTPEPTPQPEPRPAPEPEPVEPRERPDFQVGVNMFGPTYWGSACEYPDMAKIGKWAEADPEQTNYRVFVDLDGNHPYRGADLSKFTPDVDGRIIRLRHNNGIHLQVSPGSKVRHLWAPGFAPGEAYHGDLFHPLFLKRLKPFGVLRFMDWMETNSSNPDAGESVEDMVALVNVLRVDPWFCMHHKWDDGRIRKFAEYTRDNLHADARVYVEYSNEMWNRAFGQSKWLFNEKGGYDYWAQRIKAIRTIWRDVFGDQANRIIVVLAGQEANPWVVKQLVKRLAVGGERHFEAISCTAYFGGRRGPLNPYTGTKTIEAVCDALLNDITEIAGKRKEHGDIAKAHGVPLIAYEAGPHLTAHGSKLSVDFVNNVNDAQQMYGLIQANIESFRIAGGSLYCAFTFCKPYKKSGPWGHLKYINQSLDKAHKYRALVDCIGGE